MSTPLERAKRAAVKIDYLGDFSLSELCEIAAIIAAEYADQTFDAAEYKKEVSRLTQETAFQRAELKRLRASVREDDGEAVTAEWLRSVGCKSVSNVEGGVYISWLMFCRTVLGWVAAIPDGHSVSVKTRGDVRKLCEALGIGLSENTER